MEKEKIQEFISSGNPINDLYVIKFRDNSYAVGYFDKKEAYTNTSNIWQFHLNNDRVNKIYTERVLKVNGDDILTLDRL